MFAKRHAPLIGAAFAAVLGTQAFAAPSQHPGDTGARPETTRDSEQERRAGKAHRMSPLHRHARLDTLVGKTLYFEPGLEEKRKARAEGESAEQPTGTLADVLVDPRNGRLGWGIVSFGGGILGTGSTTVLIPFDALTWRTVRTGDDYERHLQLSATLAELRKLPSVDVSESAKRQWQKALSLSEKAWKRIRGQDEASNGNGARTEEASSNGSDGTSRAEDGTRKTMKDGHKRQEKGTRIAGVAPEDRVLLIGGKTYHLVTTSWILGSELDDYGVHAKDDSFGDVDHVLVDCEAKRAAFVVVGHGGALGIAESKKLLPFRALELRARKGEPSERLYSVAATKKELESGVPYEEPEQGILDAEAARRAEKRFAGRTANEDGSRRKN